MNGGVELDIQTEPVVMTLQEFRRTYYRAIRGGIKDAFERYTLPRMKAAAPRVTRPYMIARTAGLSSVYMTTKGTKAGKTADGILGLQNFGGVVRSTIRPTKRKQALRFGGRHAEYVDTWRRYDKKPKGRTPLELAMKRSIPLFEDHVDSLITDRLQRAFR